MILGSPGKTTFRARGPVAPGGHGELRPPVARRNLLFGIAVGGVVLVSAVLALTTPESVPVEFRAVAALTFIVGCLPSCFYIRDTRLSPIPTLALIGGYNVLAFSLKVFIDPETTGIYWFDTISLPALIGALMALSSQSAGFLVGRSCFRRAIRPFQLPAAPDESTLKLALWLLVALQCATAVIPAMNEISTLKQFCYFAGLGSYGVLFRLWRKHRLNRIELTVLCLFVIPLEFLTRLAKGMLAELVMPFIFFCLVVWATERVIYWKTCLIVLFSIAVLNSVKADYRMQTWVAGRSLATPAEALEGARLLGELAYKRVTDERTSAQDSRLLVRISQIGFLAHVMEQTPTPVPYLSGSSYLSLLVKPIPRVLWPGKPLEDAGYWFSERYGMRSTGDYTTSFNVPWIVEAYANFGYGGLTLGMFLIGCSIGMSDRFFIATRMTDTNLIFGIVFIYPLAFQESNFSLVVGSIIPAAIALYLYFSLWARTRSRGARG